MAKVLPAIFIDTNFLGDLLSAFKGKGDGRTTAQILDLIFSNGQKFVLTDGILEEIEDGPFKQAAAWFGHKDRASQRLGAEITIDAKDYDDVWKAYKGFINEQDKIPEGIRKLVNRMNDTISKKGLSKPSDLGSIEDITEAFGEVGDLTTAKFLKSNPDITVFIMSEDKFFRSANPLIDSFNNTKSFRISQMSEALLAQGLIEPDEFDAIFERSKALTNPETIRKYAPDLYSAENADDIKKALNVIGDDVKANPLLYIMIRPESPRSKLPKLLQVRFSKPYLSLERVLELP